MRSCPQCGTQYPDDVAVCPKDGTTLPVSTAEAAMSRPAAEQLAPTGVMHAVRLPPAAPAPPPRRRPPGLAFALFVLVPILLAIGFLVLRPRPANERDAATPPAERAPR